MGFTEEQFYAAAKWWADRLPGRSETSAAEQASGGNDIKEAAEEIARKISDQFSLSAPVKHAVTDRQYQVFMDTLAWELLMKTRETEKTFDGQSYFSVTSDYGIGTPALPIACKAAGIINGFLYLPRTTTYLYENGAILTPLSMQTYVPLAYEGQPDITTPSCYKTDAEFSGPYYMREKRCRFFELTPGQEFKTAYLDIKGNVQYRSRTARENEVLIIQSATSDLTSLTREDALNPENNPSITGITAWDKQDVADGAKERWGSGRVEKLDDNGSFRVLSAPFRAKEVTETIATGYGGDYQVLKPGDFLTETVRTLDGGYSSTSIDVVRKSWREGATWLPATSNGKLIPAEKPAKQNRGRTIKPQ